MRFDLFIDDTNVRACYTGKTARIYREQLDRKSTRLNSSHE